MITKRSLCIAITAALCAAVVALAGCNQQPSSTASPPTAASPAAQAPAYTPPTADQLYQLVAPIALFPDKLVAQVLAGSTYPDQVTAADQFLAQNTNLQAAALQNLVNPQPWDPSIKGLTVFPKVLDQMAQNIPWTTALGVAYVNDPTDVLNAVQVMRQRASQHGSLRSSAQLRVVEQPVAQTTSYTDDDGGGYPPTYAGPNVIPPPQQTIEILPAQADTVYVPYYDPQTVYGEEISPYPSYSYAGPGYSSGDLIATGAISFGVGVVIGALLDHSHDNGPRYGWNNWNMNWGGGGYRGGGNGGYGQRPAVIYNNSTYVSRSNTVINRYTNNTRINNGPTIAPARGLNNGFGRSPTAMPPGAHSPYAMNASRAPGTAAATPIHAPNFAGALSKGEPGRFSHPGTVAPPAERPLQGRAATAANRAAVPIPATRAVNANNRPPAAERQAAVINQRHAEPNRLQTPRAAAPNTANRRAEAVAPAAAARAPAQSPRERAVTSTVATPRPQQARPAVQRAEPPQRPVRTITEQRPTERPAPAAPVRREAPQPRPEPARQVAAHPAAANHAAPARNEKPKHPADENH